MEMVLEARGWATRRQLISRGLRYMAASALAFSIMSLLVKVAGQRLPSQEVVLARAIVSVAASWFVLRRRGTHVWGKAPKLLLLRGLLGFAALSCFYFSVTRLPLADATVIQFTNPVFAMLLAAHALDERIGRGEVLCVAASMLGVFLVARPPALFGGTASLDMLAV
ncbi:MAG TPA: DMT family transporter, partial [Longimicrobiales bacterium]|nr:DMT family transporter [Longimicrobiales bacterium]